MKEEYEDILRRFKMSKIINRISKMFSKKVIHKSNHTAVLVRVTPLSTYLTQSFPPPSFNHKIPRQCQWRRRF